MENKIIPEGTGFKFLAPDLCTYHDDQPFAYPVPAPGEKWGPWFEHPDPVEPDGRACGPGRLHVMKEFNARYAPVVWWPWWVQWAGKIGEDKEKVGVRYVRLRRISRSVFWKALCLGWGKSANLKEANLKEANLSGADLGEANLRGANLSGADLSGANLSEANLGWADLGWANLRGADLRWANLRRANLSGANLGEADLRWADLSGADLRGANLRWANLGEADLSGANLRWADLGEADLSGAKHNEYTAWPTGFDATTVSAFPAHREEQS